MTSFNIMLRSSPTSSAFQDQFPVCSQEQRSRPGPRSTSLEFSDQGNSKNQNAASAALLRCELLHFAKSDALQEAFSSIIQNELDKFGEYFCRQLLSDLPVHIQADGGNHLPTSRAASPASFPAPQKITPGRIRVSGADRENAQHLPEKTAHESPEYPTIACAHNLYTEDSGVHPVLLGSIPSRLTERQKLSSHSMEPPVPIESEVPVDESDLMRPRSPIWPSSNYARDMSPQLSTHVCGQLACDMHCNQPRVSPCCPVEADCRVLPGCCNPEFFNPRPRPCEMSGRSGTPETSSGEQFPRTVDAFAPCSDWESVRFPRPAFIGRDHLLHHSNSSLPSTNRLCERPGEPQHSSTKIGVHQSGSKLSGDKRVFFHRKSLAGQQASSGARAFSRRSLDEFRTRIGTQPSDFFLCRCCMVIAESTIFDYGSSALTVLNAVSMGIQTNYTAASNMEVVPGEMLISDTVFCILFTVELVVRLVAIFLRGRKSARCTQEHRWLVFDSTLVLLQIVEVVMYRVGGISAGSNAGSLNLLRVLRIMRLLRLVRLVRVFHFVKELRTLVSSVANSLLSLGWTMLLIISLIYLIGIYITQVVGNHWSDLTLGDRVPEHSDLQLRLFFGTLPLSMLSLFQAITGGLDWNELAKPMFDCFTPVAGMSFVCYIAFSQFAMLNVITGVFVDTALRNTEKEKHSSTTNRLMTIFQQCVVDWSGNMTIDKFNSSCQDPAFVLHLKHLDVDPAEARNLLFLMDTNGDGMIVMEDFVQGCLRLRGDAQAIDVVTLMFETVSSNSRIQEALEQMSAQIQVLSWSGANRRASV